jgi:ribosomal protein S18 acetylase RimI-like enzyme
VPALSSRIDLYEYAKKIHLNSEMLSLVVNKEIAGILAIYCNDKIDLCAYITAVCVLKKYWGNGYGSELLKEAFTIAKINGMKKIKLEVDKNNMHAIALYKKYEFTVKSESEKYFIMVKHV